MVKEDLKSVGWQCVIVFVIIIVVGGTYYVATRPTNTTPDHSISIYNRSFDDIGYWLYIDGVEVQNGIIGNHNTTIIVYDYPGENVIITLVVWGHDYSEVFERFYYSGFGNGIPDTTYFVVG